MDLWQLSIFCKVIELRSFSKAGEAVRLSQPTVSSHIKDLESHFGTRLVDRLARTVTPTKAGLLLYDYARRMMILRDKTETAMAEFSGKIKGHLTIGGSTIPGGYLLPKIIGSFSQRYPQTYVSMTVADTLEIIRSTLDGHIEFGIVGARSQDRNLQQEPIAEDNMCLIVPPGHKWAHRNTVSVSDLLKEPFIIRENGSGTLRSLQDNLKKSHHQMSDLHVVAEMGSTEAVRQAVKSGVGVSVLSRIAVHDDVRTGLLKTVSIRGLDLERHFYLTMHRQRSLSPLGITFVEFLKAHIKVT